MTSIGPYSKRVEEFRPRRGQYGRRAKSVKKIAALLQFLAFGPADHNFGVLRGEQPLRRGPLPRNSGTFFVSFFGHKKGQPWYVATYIEVSAAGWRNTESRPLKRKKSINRFFPPVGQAVDGVIGFNEAVFIIGVGIGGVGSHHAGGTALQVFFGLFLAAGDGVGQCFLGDFSNLFILVFQSKHSFHGQARLAAKTMAASQQSWPARADQSPTGALIAARPRNAKHRPYGGGYPP